ncbi:hypothetical protein [Aliihoeflea sp. PC F10.4]
MDDLTRINGIGAATTKRLNAAGITTFEQLGSAAVGQHGVKAEWIYEAAKFIAAKDTTAREGDGDVPDTGVSVVPPQPEIIPPSETVSGAGNPVSPAASIDLGDISDADLAAIDAVITTAEDDFQRLYPRVWAAVSAFQAQNGDATPVIARIVSSRPGFRRAGIAHSDRPTDHRVDVIGVDALELILGEPMLKVEFL